MAVDTSAIVLNLLSFYDFKDQEVISVGAGGGQLIAWAHHARKITAIDCDENALIKLSSILAKQGLTSKFKLINAPFEKVNVDGDIVLFEFCLHEMDSSTYAIKHAKELASSIVIIDHWLGSEWAYVVSEDEKVRRSWQFQKIYSAKKLTIFHTFQRFNSYDELYHKVKGQGYETIMRIEKYKGTSNFAIPMSYALALV